MYNYVMLVGTVESVTEIKVDNGKCVEPCVELCLGCKRPFKNPDGTYTVDNIIVSFYDFAAEICITSVREHETIKVKGRVLPVTPHGRCRIIGERIIFMRSDNNETNS